MSQSSASYHREYYHSKRDKAALLKQKAERAKRIRQQVWDYLLLHPCVDCGISDPVVLEFDHVRGDKEINISDALLRGWSYSRILSEIEKCEVRCANCHRLRTHIQFNRFQGVAQSDESTRSGPERSLV